VAVGVEPTLTTGQGKSAARSALAEFTTASRSCTAMALMASTVFWL